jgi:hypothetical protein
MHSSAKTLLALITTTGLALLCVSAAAQENDRTIDRAFAPGLAILKKTTGLIEDQPEQLQTDWKPDLQLLVGVKTVEGSKQTVYFVELTTLLPPTTNATGQPWSPALHTNWFGWSNNVSKTKTTAKYVSSLYPVRVRVFDRAGKKTKEGLTTLPWGLLTNGLVDTCRLSLELSFREKAAKESPPMKAGLRSDELVASSRKETAAFKDKWMRSYGGGLLWLVTMMSQIQTVPAVKEIWQSGQCAFRLPGVWTMVSSVFSGPLVISLDPDFEKVSLVGREKSTPHYKFPIDLNSGKRNLTAVEAIVGSASGAEMLLGGIRSIRATHPTKPQQQLFAQVLASGKANAEHPK